MYLHHYQLILLHCRYSSQNHDPWVDFPFLLHGIYNLIDATYRSYPFYNLISEALRVEFLNHEKDAHQSQASDSL